MKPSNSQTFFGISKTKELIYFGISMIFMGICLFLIKWIDYNHQGFQWWNDLRLFTSVRFNLDKYLALKIAGVQYKHLKRKSKHRKSKRRKLKTPNQ